MELKGAAPSSETERKRQTTRGGEGYGGGAGGGGGGGGGRGGFRTRFTNDHYLMRIFKIWRQNRPGWTIERV